MQMNEPKKKSKMEIMHLPQTYPVNNEIDVNPLINHLFSYNGLYTQCNMRNLSTCLDSKWICLRC